MPANDIQFLLPYQMLRRTPRPLQMAEPQQERSLGSE